MFAPARQPRDQPRGRKRRRHPNCENGLGGRSAIIESVRKLIDGFCYRLEKASPFRIEQELVGAPREQLPADMMFQLLDAATQGGNRQIQFF